MDYKNTHVQAINKFTQTVEEVQSVRSHSARFGPFSKSVTLATPFYKRITNEHEVNEGETPKREGDVYTSILQMYKLVAGSVRV